MQNDEHEIFCNYIGPKYGPGCICRNLERIDEKYDNIQKDLDRKSTRALIIIILTFSLPFIIVILGKYFNL